MAVNVHVLCLGCGCRTSRGEQRVLGSGASRNVFYLGKDLGNSTEAAEKGDGQAGSNQ